MRSPRAAGARAVRESRYYGCVPTTRRVALIGVCGLIAAALFWFLRDRREPPVPIDTTVFANWPVIVSDGTDPWVVAVAPPDKLMTMLTADVARRAGRRLVAPSHPALPLVLRDEFSDALQGVYGTDSLTRMAREAGIETARFEPVCLAHRVSRGPDGDADLYFVPFASSVFSQFRVDLMPAFPEHAGIGIYDPSTLTPILIVGSSDGAFERWWPLSFNRDTDCVATISAPTADQN